MDGGVLVDLPDDGQQLVLAHVRGQDEGTYRDADRAAPLHGAPLIGQIVLPLTHPDDGQGGKDTLLRQGGGPGLEPAVQGGGDLFAG